MERQILGPYRSLSEVGTSPPNNLYTPHRLVPRTTTTTKTITTTTTILWSVRKVLRNKEKALKISQCNFPFLRDSLMHTGKCQGSRY